MADTGRAHDWNGRATDAAEGEGDWRCGCGAVCDHAVPCGRHGACRPPGGAGTDGVRADELRVGDVVTGYGRLTHTRRDEAVVTLLAAGRDPIHVHRESLHPVEAVRAGRGATMRR